MFRLAGVVMKLKRYDEAEALYRQALEMYKKVHGDEHPSVACALSNLALLLKDMGKPDEVGTFLKNKGGENLPAWLDPENDLAFGYGGGVLPTTVLYDAQGKEVWRYVGGNEWDSKEAQALLAEAR